MQMELFSLLLATAALKVGAASLLRQAVLMIKNDLLEGRVQRALSTSRRATLR